jgi:tRNA threonylcarbamoyladenosine biosynthesis protein TsaB
LTCESLRLLALDTSTHRVSVALQHGGPDTPVDDWAGEGGAQASASLLPGIQGLLAHRGLTLGDLDAIVFGQGPGAFTGLRTATAVVQGLAYGVRTPRHPQGLPVLPIDTLRTVSEDARQHHGQDGALWVVSVLDARMGEVYAAIDHFPDARQPQAHRLGGPWLLTPAQLPALVEATLPPHTPCLLASNALALLPPLARPHTPCEAWPTAAALLRLAPPLLAQGQAVTAAQAQPLYVRDKVAQTTAERMAPTAPRPPHHG